MQQIEELLIFLNILNYNYNYYSIKYLYKNNKRLKVLLDYLIDNNYDLSYVSKNSEPVITFAAHSGEIEFLNLLLKHKDKFDLYAKNKRFDANALEILIWRGEEKLESIEALLNAGMKFSISSYNNTLIGKEILPFKDVKINVKKALLKRYIFEKVLNQVNIVDELDKNKNMKSFSNVKIYFEEYLDFA